MSFFIAASATAAVTTVATVAVAIIPDVHVLLAPLIDGNEYAVSTVSVLASAPILTIMTVLAASGRE